MNTQSHLFENSDKIPEQLYVELMNKLKMDFEAPRVVVIDKLVPSTVVCKKTELVQRIMQKSKTWHDREDVLQKIVTMSHNELKKFCDARAIGTMKPNPKYTTQYQTILKLKEHAESSQRIYLSSFTN